MRHLVYVACWLALVPLLGYSQSTDVRHETYPDPTVESTHRLRLDLGKGCSFQLIGAGRVDVEHKKAICWDEHGKISDRLSTIMTEACRQRSDRLKYVPHPKSDRFLIYVFTGDWKPELGWTARGGGEFLGFFTKNGVTYHTRLLLDGSSAKSLSLYIDQTISTKPVRIPCQVGSTAKIGRGKITVTKLHDGSRGTFDVGMKCQGEVFASIMPRPVDAEGKAVTSPEANGGGWSSNTLAMSPAKLLVDRSRVKYLDILAPIVRRYLLFGVPANPVGG